MVEDKVLEMAPMVNDHEETQQFVAQVENFTHKHRGAEHSHDWLDRDLALSEWEETSRIKISHKIKQKEALEKFITTKSSIYIILWPLVAPTV